MKEKFELRLLNSELTGTESEGGLRVSGYVNKTNQWSQTLGSRKKFVERILPNTFRKALQNGNEIHFYAEHDPTKILASTRNSSLELREDEQGLFMSATIEPTSYGKDYHTLIKSGIIRNMSFGMKVLKDSWKKLSDGTYERSISDILLAEVSAVRNPAYVQSTISARSIDIVDDPQINLSKENENKMFNENTIDVYRQKLESFDKQEARKNTSNVVKQEFASFNEQLTQTDFEAEKRAIESIIKGELKNDEVRTLTQGENGYLVPTSIADYIVEKVHDNAKLFSRSKVFEPVNGFLEILKEGFHGSAGFVGENTPFTPNDFTMNKVKLDQKRVGTAIELSNDLVNDTGIDILKLATNILAKRLANYIDERILWGENIGSSSLDFQGVIPYKIATDDVFKSISQTQINFDDLREMIMSVHEEYAKNGIWLMHWETFGHLLKIKDDTGKPLILKDKITEAPIYELFGQPIVFCDSMEKISAGKFPILFGNFGEGYATIVKKDFHLQHIYKDRISKQKRRHLLVLDKYLDGKILNEECFTVLKMAD
ncbi:phage major capsid protein [Bacillus sp. PK5-004]